MLTSFLCFLQKSSSVLLMVDFVLVLTFSPLFYKTQIQNIKYAMHSNYMKYTMLHAILCRPVISENSECRENKISTQRTPPIEV